MNIKFYLSPYVSPTQANYQHQSIVLAEGFDALGNIRYSSNIDYWYVPELEDYLFRNSDLNNIDIAIYSSQYVRDVKQLKLKSCFNILIDSQDGSKTLSTNDDFKAFDLILKSHYVLHQKEYYLNNVIPWCFGLSNRIINSIDDSRISVESSTSIEFLKTYRVSHNVREFYNNLFEETGLLKVYESESLSVRTYEGKDKVSYWCQTGRRHNQNYYNEINKHTFLMSFGGIFEPKYFDIDFLPGLLKRLGLNEHILFNIIQWDSWRFWEGFYANCIPIHVDLDDWGMILPIKPINREHYIGISRNNVQSDIKSILRMEVDQIESITRAGYFWAKEFYSPQAIADRLMSFIANNY